MLSPLRVRMGGRGFAYACFCVFETSTLEPAWRRNASLDTTRFTHPTHCNVAGQLKQEKANSSDCESVQENTLIMNSVYKPADPQLLPLGGDIHLRGATGDQKKNDCTICCCKKQWCEGDSSC